MPNATPGSLHDSTARHGLPDSAELELVPNSDKFYDAFIRDGSASFSPSPEGIIGWYCAILIFAWSTLILLRYDASDFWEGFWLLMPLSIGGVGMFVWYYRRQRDNEILDGKLQRLSRNADGISFLKRRPEFQTVAMGLSNIESLERDNDQLLDSIRTYHNRIPKAFFNVGLVFSGFGLLYWIAGLIFTSYTFELSGTAMLAFGTFFCAIALLWVEQRDANSANANVGSGAHGPT